MGIRGSGRDYPKDYCCNSSEKWQWFRVIAAEIVQSVVILDKQHLYVESPGLSDGLEIGCE